MKIEVKNLKTFETHDGGAFNGSVWIDGKRAGTVSNGGYGGPNEYEPAALFATLDAHAQTCPPVPVGNGHTMPTSPDILIGEAMGDFIRKQWAKRQCRNKTLFRMPGDAPDTYRTINRPFDSSIKAQIEMRFGDTVQFLNEQI